VNRDGHSTASLLSSILLPLLTAPHMGQSPLHQILGAAGGAYVGGRLPDIIDPPTSPRHRSIAHGCVPTSAALTRIWQHISPVWESAWIEQAERYKSLYVSECNPFLKFIYWIGFQISHCLVWACKGFVVGYVSHLICDNQTPMGLPIFV